MIREEWDALEADVQAHYGADLRAWCWGPDAIGCRRLYVLLSSLPPGGALDRARNPRRAGWGVEADLLALVLDRLALVERAIVRASFAAAGKRPHLPRFEPYPRPKPGHDEPIRGMSWNEFAAMMEQRGAFDG